MKLSDTYMNIFFFPPGFAEFTLCRNIHIYQNLFDRSIKVVYIEKDIVYQIRYFALNC